MTDYYSVETQTEILIPLIVQPQKHLLFVSKVHIMKIRLFVLELLKYSQNGWQVHKAKQYSKSVVWLRYSQTMCFCI